MVKKLQPLQRFDDDPMFDPFAGWREDQKLQYELSAAATPDLEPLQELLQREAQPTESESESQTLRRVRLELELCVNLLWRVRTMRRLQERLTGPGQGAIDRSTRAAECDVDEALAAILTLVGPFDRTGAGPAVGVAATAAPA